MFEKIYSWIHELSGIYPNQLVPGGAYLDKKQKKSYKLYDHSDFVVVNYFDHKTQESISKRFNKNGTDTSKIKYQPPQLIQSLPSPQLSKKQQCYYDAKQFHDWSTTPNRAFNYLKRKRLEKEGTQLIASNQLRFGHWDNNGDWLAFLVESAIDGEPLGVQRIFEDSTKKNSKGFDKSRLPCIWLGHNPDAEPTELNICEGIATAMSIMVVKGTAISAIDAGNLPKVVKQLRQQYPNIPIYVYADNDNAGHKAVQKCDQITNASFFPIKEGHDWNDVYREGGTDEVERQINALKWFWCPNDNASHIDGGIDEARQPTTEPTKKCLSVDEGVNLLKQTVRTAFQSTDYSTVTAIAASAGIGKTNAVLEELRQIKNLASSNGVWQKSQTTFYFVSNHALAKEIHEKAVQMGLSSSIRKGRTHDEQMCQKQVLVEKLAKVGIKRVMKLLCRNEKLNEKCEHYDKCPYIQQYHQSEVPDLILMTHEYLTLDYSELEYEQKIFPKRIVIDESFYQKLVKDSSIQLSQITENTKIPEKVKEAFTLAATLKKPFLKTFRDYNITADTLTQLVSELESQSEKIQLNISPSMPIDEQLKQITSYSGDKKTGTIKKILQTIAEELDQLPNRQDSVRVHAIKDSSMETRIICNYLLPIRRIATDPQNRRPLPHILVIDADADVKIMEKIFPNMKIHYVEIPVRRNAEIFQVDNVLVSSKYNGSQTTERHIRGQSYFDAMKSIESKLDGKTLIVSMSNVEERIKEEIENIDTEHFGNIRGLDKYRDYDNLIIYGYFQPPVYTVENEARALFWDEANSDEDFVLNGQMENQSVKYQNRERHTEVPMHLNPYVNTCLKQHRECEIQQCIDRLRLIHCQEKKKVFILTKLPLPNVEITELMPLKKIVAIVAGEPLPTTRDERIIAQTLNGDSGVLPFSVDILPTLFPKEFKTAKSAERWRENLLKSVERNNPHDVYNVLYTRWGLFNKVTYYEYSIGRGKNQYCLSRHDEGTTQSILEKWHNKTVVVKLSIVVSPHKAHLPDPKDLIKLEEVKVPQSHNSNQITQFPKETFVWHDLMTRIKMITTTEIKQEEVKKALEKLIEKKLVAEQD